MTDEVVIRVENLGKKYKIHHQAERQRYTALRDVIAEKAFGFFRGRKPEAGGQPGPSSVLRPPKISGPCATIPSQFAGAKSSASSACPVK